MLYSILLVIIVIAAILMGLAVLMQNSKGGGLSSTFGGASQIMGVRKTADFLEKATWGLAISIVVLCFVSSFLMKSPTSGTTETQGSKAAKGVLNNPMPMQQTTNLPAEEVPVEQVPVQ
ncbi:MAG: preprotein translocase subunit SecG [Bacteroidales bacterium]|jgi:preprotein translocase subunit SecG|nr:preprotein translocase subunit SecG [Bacteroidales bacterium]